MNLLALNLQSSSAINLAIYGNFSGPKQQEIAVAKGNTLELLRPDDTGKVISICATPVFCIIRSLHQFRLSGANRDYVVIGSDSGKISIVEFDVKLSDWKTVHCEVFGKTGCRRIVPGQYVAADPKGRAILIAAVEKQKFVYVMNRDASNQLTISSPLEAHKAETIVFSVCGVDVGFENPVFALIELEYKEADQDPTGEAFQDVEKNLSFYELDLGLNHVVRKWSEPISRTANFLLAVPGGDVWPSGVLICGENWISYKNQGHVEVRAALPRRHDLPLERGVLITAGTVHKQKDLFFFILQSEYGDLYKVVFDLDPNDPKIVTNVIVTVFDTIPVASSLCITKTGLLFTASEFSNHCLFQFQGIGDQATVRSERIQDDELNEELGDDSLSASRVAPVFKASPRLQNLLLTDDVPSLAPITDLLVEDLVGMGQQESRQIYALCGRGHRSSVRVLKHGVAITEMAVSDLPGRPTAVWTVKKAQEDEFDSYIVVSFSNATLVLSIGDTVEEVTDSGFLATSPTLQVALLADNALIQVHNYGIRHIPAEGITTEWKTPGRGAIQFAAANTRQVAVALAGGEIIYFELDAAGQLIEMGSIDMGKEVSSLDIGVIPEGRSRSMFLAVGTWDDTVQLLSLDPSDILGKGPAFSVESRPASLCLVEMTREQSPAAGDSAAAASTPAAAAATGGGGVHTSLYLNVGLESGVLLRVAVDPITGDFSDARQKFLGPKAIRLCRVTVHGAVSVMALTTRAWLMYNYQNRYHQDPLSYEALEYAADFSSEACPGGLVAVADNTLRIITIDNLGAIFNQTALPLRYTPRKMCQFPGTSDLVIVESDHNTFSQADTAAAEKLYSVAEDGAVACEVAAAAAALAERGAAASTVEEGESAAMDIASGSGSGDSAAATTATAENKEKDKQEGEGGENSTKVENEEEEEEEEEEEGTSIPVRGPIPGMEGKWASCIRVLDTHTGTDKCIIELGANEAAFSVCTCRFAEHSEETFIVVGTCTDLQLHPKRWSGCAVLVYRLLGDTLQLLHRTEVEDIPMCLMEFQGRLLVGLGRCLRMYDLGKRKLLKKCEHKALPASIVRMQCMGDRIFVGDLMDSVLFVKYRRHDNALVIFADDANSRFITSMCVLDYSTVAAVDKFGNVFTLRLPEHANDEVESGAGSSSSAAAAAGGNGVSAGANLLWEQGKGAPNKLELLNHYYLGETPTAIVKCALKINGKEVLLVSTVTGGLYAFVPAKSKEEVSFFQHLEMFMRQEFATLCQRDHMSYRSYFQPVKNTVDGELCERYMSLSYAKQREFGDDVDRTPPEIVKKLEELRDFV